MKNKDEEKEIKKIVRSGLLHTAPIGLVDRIMANVSIMPRKHLSVKPLEPSPFIAAGIVAGTVILILIAFVVKPDSWSYFSVVVNYFDFKINPVWILPIGVFTVAIWAYIIAQSKSVNHRE